eukprot:tig00000144_g9111.t1
MRNAPPIDNALGGGKPLHVNRSPTAASPASFPAGIVVLASRSNCCRAAPLAPHRGHARNRAKSAREGSVATITKQFCLACPAGRYRNENMTDCDICPWKTVSLQGSPSCTPCSPGYYARDDRTVCEPCRPGFYESDGRCLECPLGSVSGTDASVACGACPAGSVASIDRKSCTACPRGTFRGAGDAACAPCEFKFVAPSPGWAACALCEPGTVSRDDRTVCEPCRPGFYESDGRCLECPLGSISWEEGSTACQACPLGTVASADRRSCVDSGPTAHKCNPPLKTPPARKYPVACPPNVTIAGVGPVAVPVNGTLKALCGARMPDLRFHIAGNWSDARVNVTQEPREGTFLPMHVDAAPTSPEWLAAGLGAPSPATGIPVTITIDNPTDSGPEGRCSFGLYVGEAGRQLCPEECPPPVQAAPIDPATCAVAFPDLRRGLALWGPGCIPPLPAAPEDYVQEGAGGGEDAGVQPNATWALAGPPPYAKDVRLRHRLFPRGSSCPVRVLAYLPLPAVAWETSVAGTPPPSLVRPRRPARRLGPHLHRTVVGMCPGLLLRHCRPHVRVEMNAKLGLAGPDVSAAGNFTFGAGRVAWALAAGPEAAPASVVGDFSREVPDHYLARPDIAPGEVLRTYVVGLTCAINKGVPEPGQHSLVALAPFRVEIRRPQPSAA